VPLAATARLAGDPSQGRRPKVDAFRGKPDHEHGM